MYKLKNYLLSMQSHWMVNQPLYESVQESMPDIARFRSKQGVESLKKLPLMNHCKRVFPDIWKVPLLRRQYCKLLVEELDHMRKEIGFEPNQDEDILRQIPEIVLREQNVLNPIFWCLYQRDCAEISSVQIANYNIKEKVQGAWHHDESADISVVVPLNTGDYVGGGTEFHNHGVLNPLPTGHGLIFPSFSNMHRGLPVTSGDRYLLVFWLHDRKRLLENKELLLEDP